MVHAIMVLGFNPLPARRPGATLGDYVRVYDDDLGFNPLPARRPGATAPMTVPIYGLAMFQSSPSPKAGSYPRRHTIFGA